ncbi:hypothetical protein [Streptomyces sp. NPDC001635]
METERARLWWRTTGPWQRGTVVVALLAALIAVVLALRTVFAPWAFPLPGQPRLTGYWQGEISYSKTDSRRILLRLNYNENCDSVCGMTGGMKVCGAGKDASGDVSGDVRNWRGTRFSVSPYLPRSKGDVNIEHIDGTWKGDELRMLARTAIIDSDGAWHSDQQRPDPPEFVMHRSSEAAFEAGCAKG